MTSQKLTAFPVTKTKRRYSALDATKLFIRDGFVDQYTSEHLVFPGVLRLLSRLFETEFPYHPNWKFGVCHYWYWELYPTVDHVVPVTAGGSDSEENWVTTSMMRNLKKSNRTLPPGWPIRPESHQHWDGLMPWFIQYLDAHPELKRVSYLRKWYRAALDASKAKLH